LRMKCFGDTIRWKDSKQDFHSMDILIDIEEDRLIILHFLMLIHTINNILFKNKPTMLSHYLEEIFTQKQVMEWVEWLMLIKVDIQIQSKYWGRFLWDINKKKCGGILWDNIEKKLVIVEDQVNILMIMFHGNMKCLKVAEKHFKLEINFNLLSLKKKYKKKHMIIWRILNINLDRVNENW
jgi:hypothetical protein